MNISLAKALLGTLSVGASGLGVYGVYKLASPSPSKKIKQVLQEDKKVVLLDVEGNTNDSDWDQKVTELGGSNVTIKLDEYDKNAEGDKKAKVKEICKKLFVADSKEGNKLEQARQWCTKAASTVVS